jgi:hypothetical protein
MILSEREQDFLEQRSAAMATIREGGSPHVVRGRCCMRSWWRCTGRPGYHAGRSC